jgi:hypothetical protein
MQHRHEQDEDLEAPPKLVTALRQLPAERIFIPPAMDDAVLAAARRHLAKRERPSFNWFPLVRWVAAAALVLLLASLTYVLTQPPSTRPREVTLARNKSVSINNIYKYIRTYYLWRAYGSYFGNSKQIDANLAAP